MAVFLAGLKCIRMYFGMESNPLRMTQRTEERD